MDEDSLDGITALSNNLSFNVQNTEIHPKVDELIINQFSKTEDLRLKCSKTIFLDGKFFLSQL